MDKKVCKHLMFFGDVSQCDIGCPTDTDCKGGKTKCAFYVALYSDPPSPEMVCPECDGKGKVISRYKEINSNPFFTTCPECGGKGRQIFKGFARMAKGSCLECHGTGKVPSPEHPEKVREMSHEIAEIIKPAYKANGEKYADVAINASCLLLADAIILKLQQAGWGGDVAEIKRIAMKEENEIEQILGRVLGCPWYKNDLKNFPNATEADGVCVGDEVPISLAMQAANRITKQEARIKELEALLEKQTKMKCKECPYNATEARQQALKTLMDWGNERCPHFKDTNLHSYPVIYSLKRGCDKCWNEYFEGELPKE